MCCEQLICANCGQPVIDARCSVCVVARAQVHRGDPMVSAAWLAVIVATLLATLVVLYGGFAH